MIRFYRHIALLLLFLLSGTLAADAAIAMVGVSQISDRPAHTMKANMYCAAGFLISNDYTAAEDPLVHKTGEEDAQETEMMVISNCYSSLQLLISKDIAPLVPEKSIPYDNFVLLISSQSYILEIADPPRA